MSLPGSLLKEVYELFEPPRSLTCDQAENRLRTIRAVRVTAPSPDRSA